MTAPGGALEALLAAKAAGKIGHIGVTAHMAGVFEKALTMDWVETVMFPYNIVETQGEALMQKCREQNVGFICMKPMAGGALEDARLAMRFISSMVSWLWSVAMLVVPKIGASSCWAGATSLCLVLA